MATTEMSVERKLPKKSNRMMMTKNEPSNKLRPTLFTDASIKSA